MNARTRAAVRMLRDVLQQDAMFARRLVDVANALTRALIEADPDRVEQLQAVADTVSARQESNDARRAEAARALAEATGLSVAPDQRPPTLLEIARRLPAAEGRPIIEIRERILGLHLELSTVNEKNRHLIDNLRDCTRATVEVLVSAAARPLTYGPSGHSKAPTVYVDQAA